MAQQDKKIPVNSEVEKKKEGSEKVQNKNDTHGSLSSDIEGCESQPDADRDFNIRVFGENVFAGGTSQNQVGGQSNVLAVMPAPFGHPKSFGRNRLDRRFGSDDLDYSGGQDGSVMNKKIIEMETRINPSFIDEDSQECLNFENASACIPPVSLGRGDSVTKEQDSMKKVSNVPEIFTNPVQIHEPKSERKKDKKYPGCLKNEPVLSYNKKSTKNSLDFGGDILKILGLRIGNILNAKQHGNPDENAPMELDGTLPSVKNKHMEPKQEPPQQKTPEQDSVDDTNRHKEFRNDKDEEKIPIQEDPDKEILDHDGNIGKEALENGIDENGQKNSGLQQNQDDDIQDADDIPELNQNDDPIVNDLSIDNVNNNPDFAQHQTKELDNEDVSHGPDPDLPTFKGSIDYIADGIMPETADITQPQTTETRNREISPSKLAHIPELLTNDDLFDNRAEDIILGATADDLSKNADEFCEESQNGDFVDGVENKSEELSGNPPVSNDEFCEEKLSVYLPTVEDVVDGMGNTPDELPDPVPDDENTNMSNNDESSPQEHMADQFQSPEIKIPAPGKKSKGNSDEEEEKISACDATMGSNGGEDQDSSDDDNTDIDESEDEVTSLKRLYKKSKDISSDDETVETEAEFIKQKADGKLFTPPTSDVVVQNYQVSHSYPQRLDTFVNSRHVSERIPCDDLARNGYILTGYTAICLGCDTRHSIRDIEGRPSRNIVWHQDNCPFMNMRRPCADCTSTFVDDYGLEYCTQCRQPIRRIRATSDLLAHLPQNLEPPDPSGRTFNSCVICHRDIQYRQNQDVCVVCGGRICRRCVRREERHFH